MTPEIPLGAGQDEQARLEELRQREIARRLALRQARGEGRTAPVEAVTTREVRKVEAARPRSFRRKSSPNRSCPNRFPKDSPTKWPGSAPAPLRNSCCPTH